MLAAIISEGAGAALTQAEAAAHAHAAEDLYREAMNAVTLELGLEHPRTLAIKVPELKHATSRLNFLSHFTCEGVYSDMFVHVMCLVVVGVSGGQTALAALCRSQEHFDTAQRLFEYN